MEYVKLEEICTIVSGGTPSRSKPNYWNNGNIPWIKIKDMKSKYIDSAEEFITEEGLNNSSTKMLKRDTILYSIFATLGEVGILKIDACTNQAIAGLSLKEDSNILKEYLYYYLKSKKKDVNNLGRGVAQNNINLSLLRKFKIPVIPLRQQKKIIEVLDNVSSTINNYERELTLLDELVKARFVEMFGDLRVNDKGWKYYKLDELTELITDGEHATPKRTTQGIYLLSARNVLNHQLSLEDVDYIDYDEFSRISRRIIPREGDVLISCSGSIGRCCVVPKNIKFQMVRSIALLRFKSNINPVFAEYMITSDYLQDQINKSKTASSQANLFQGKIKSLKGVVPPLELQNQFASFVQEIDKSRSRIQKSLEASQELFDSLMQEYFG